MQTPYQELIEELKELHTNWRLRRKNLRWWKEEAGYYKNIRSLCKIPLPRPDSQILIGCLYIMQLDYISERTSSKSARRKISKYRAEVFSFLKSRMQKYSIPTFDEGTFPWSPPQAIAL